ncbi:hypothetical protein LCGC14_2995710, partial [marine sediment metagenome]
ANMFQPSLGQAMGEGLRPKEGGFSANVNLGGLAQSIIDIFNKRKESGSTGLGIEGLRKLGFKVPSAGSVPTVNAPFGNITLS